MQNIIINYFLLIYLDYVKDCHDAHGNDLAQLYIGDGELAYAFAYGTVSGTTYRTYTYGSRCLCVDSDVLLVADSSIFIEFDPEDTLYLPWDTEVVEAGAFEGCAARNVRIDTFDSVRMIGSRAFANCPNLMYIEIDASNDGITIADDAFADSPHVHICGTFDKPGRLQVLEYAYSHGIPFVEMDW